MMTSRPAAHRQRLASSFALSAAAPAEPPPPPPPPPPDVQQYDAAAGLSADAGTGQPGAERRLGRLARRLRVAAAAADAAAQRALLQHQSRPDQPGRALAAPAAALLHREHPATRLRPAAVSAAPADTVGAAAAARHRPGRRRRRRRRPAGGPAEAAAAAAGDFRPATAGQPAAAAGGEDGLAGLGVLHALLGPTLVR